MFRMRACYRCLFGNKNDTFAYLLHDYLYCRPGAESFIRTCAILQNKFCKSKEKTISGEQWTGNSEYQIIWIYPCSDKYFIVVCLCTGQCRTKDTHSAKIWKTCDFLWLSTVWVELSTIIGDYRDIRDYWHVHLFPGRLGKCTTGRGYCTNAVPCC